MVFKDPKVVQKLFFPSLHSNSFRCTTKYSQIFDGNPISGYNMELAFRLGLEMVLAKFDFFLRTLVGSNYEMF